MNFMKINNFELGHESVLNNRVFAVKKLFEAYLKIVPIYTITRKIS